MIFRADAIARVVRERFSVLDLIAEVINVSHADRRAGDITCSGIIVIPLSVQSRFLRLVTASICYMHICSHQLRPPPSPSPQLADPLNHHESGTGGGAHLPHSDRAIELTCPLGLDLGT